MLKKSYFSNIIILFIFLFYAYLLFTLFLNFYDKKEGFTQKNKKTMKDLLADAESESADAADPPN